MGLVCRIGRHLPALIVSLGALTPLGQTPSWGQFFPASRYEPADDVTLDLADSATRNHLERVNVLLADQQWDDAVEILRQVMANHGGKMFEVADQRYIGLRDYCQLRLAALPEPALKLYRERVDPEARRLYEQGLRNLDRSALEQVAQQYFASSVGDDALFALGEMSLSAANYAAARNAWGMLIEWPQEPIPANVFQQVRSSPDLAAADAQLLDRWYRPIDTADSPYQVNRMQSMPDDTVRDLVRLWNRFGVLPKRMAYPGTDQSLASVRARLVLASVLESTPERAGDELAAFTHLHPQAEGKLAGRSGKYVDLLSGLLEQSRQWPELATPQTWHTFAGNEQRNFVGRTGLDLGELAWKRSLPDRNTASDFRIASSFGFSPRRVAEDSDGLLSYHPIVVGNLVFVGGPEKMLGFDLATGEPAWGSSDGVVFKLPEQTARSHTQHSRLGAARFTLSAHDHVLFARMGSPVTSSVVESPFNNTSVEIDWFDLHKQAAKLNSVETKLNSAEAQDDKRLFDGVPVSDGQHLYVALRHSEAGPQAQAHVACYDVQTGKLRWRRFICAAVTAGRSQMDEITHNLLTLDQGVLYFNTNLGAVAALSAADGNVLWISCYKRSLGGELSRTAKHVYRDLNPCVLDKGRVFIAPADSERLFCFSASTGELLWGSAAGCPEDAVHLLGVLGDTLVASGDRLWGFNASTGRVAAVWPDNTSPLGFGRGVLMGDEVVWPTRQDLYRFRLEQRVVRDPETGGQRAVSWWRNTHIDSLQNQGATGGNLVVAPDHLLIATSDTLYAFKRYPTKKSVVSSQ